MSNIDISKEFYISLSHNEFPIESSPYRIGSCIVCICLAGSADVEIDLQTHHFQKNDIIEAFPGQIIATMGKSPDFCVAWLSFSNQMLDDIMYRLPAEFIGMLKRTVKYPLPEDECRDFISDYFATIAKIFDDRSNICRRQMILNLVHNFYLGLYSKSVMNNKLQMQYECSRKKEIQNEFFRLMKEHPDQRNVLFFAEQLCITPKYLSMVTKDTTGSSAKDLIDKFAIAELKLQLRAANIPLKIIAEQLAYPCEAFLCKYFKKHTGITPSNYRNSLR